MKRLFIAVDLSRELSARLAACFPEETPGCRPVRLNPFHLTLRFIGSADEELIPPLRSRLDAVRAPAFDLTLSATGFFPSDNRPRVFWIGVEPSAVLKDLQQQVERAVQAAGFPGEDREFSAHITLARMRPPFRAGLLPSPFWRAMRQFRGERVAVPSFRLYASTTASSGPVHTLLQEISLTADDADNTDDFQTL